jgi:AcrR family transcriptional regulator
MIERMLRNAEATRGRLIAAAIDEFAARGLAGGRVDRIAAVAKANKAQIYHYFGSKDRLFDAAFEAMVVEIVADVPPQGDDLVAYAGRLFDNYERRPEVRRMAAWRRLERGEAHPPLEPIVKSNRASIRAIAEARRSGKISDRFAPVDLLALVLTLAAMWPGLTHELSAEVSKHSRTRRRKVITDAVSALIAA